MILLNLLLLLTGQLAFVQAYEHDPLYQHFSRALCFDLSANGASYSNVDSDCTFYVYNNGHTNGETGLAKNVAGTDAHDCIQMTYPREDKYTYVWTTCDDALWIDQMTLFGDACQTGSKEVYGYDNTWGWCLSTDEDDHGGWNANSGTCFKMLKLGKPSQNDNSVWGYHHTSIGRRNLAALNEATEEVRKCEKSEEKSEEKCTELATKAIKLMIEGEGADSWDRLAGAERTGECEFLPTLKNGRQVPIKENLPVADGSYVQVQCEKIDVNLHETFSRSIQCVDGQYKFYGPYDGCEKGQDCTFGLDICSGKAKLEETQIPDLEVTEKLWDRIQRNPIAESRWCPIVKKGEAPSCFAVTNEELGYKVGRKHEITEVFGISLDAPSKLVYDPFIQRWERDLVFGNGLIGDILEYPQQRNRRGEGVFAMYLVGSTRSTREMDIHVKFCHPEDPCDYFAYLARDHVDDAKDEEVHRHKLGGIKLPEYKNIVEIRQSEPQLKQSTEALEQRLKNAGIAFEDSVLGELTGGDRRHLTTYTFVSITFIYNEWGVSLEEWEMHSWIDFELYQLNTQLKDHGVNVRVWKTGLENVRPYNSGLLRNIAYTNSCSAGTCRADCQSAANYLPASLKSDLYFCIVENGLFGSNGCADDRYSCAKQGAYMDDNTIAHEICHNFGKDHHTFDNYMMSVGTKTFNMHSSTANKIAQNAAGDSQWETNEQTNCQGTR